MRRLNVHPLSPHLFRDLFFFLKRLSVLVNGKDLVQSCLMVLFNFMYLFSYGFSSSFEPL